MNLKEKIEKLYNQGLTQQQVADRLGVNQDRVFRYMKAHGIKARPAGNREGNKRVDVSIKEIVRLYVAEKKSTQTIGRELGCSGMTVRNRLKEAGVQLRPMSYYYNKWKGNHAGARNQRTKELSEVQSTVSSI